MQALSQGVAVLNHGESGVAAMFRELDVEFTHPGHDELSQVL